MGLIAAVSSYTQLSFMSANWSEDDTLTASEGACKHNKAGSVVDLQNLRLKQLLPVTDFA